MVAARLSIDFGYCGSPQGRPVFIERPASIFCCGAGGIVDLKFLSCGSAAPSDRGRLGHCLRRSSGPTSGPSEAEEAIVRLVGAILIEQNDECAVQRARYMTLETIAPLSDDPTVSLRADGSQEGARRDSRTGRERLSLLKNVFGVGIGRQMIAAETYS
jgi:hypothetical protein